MIIGIKPKYPKSFPVDYHNDVNGWGFSEIEIENAKTGKDGPLLLTLDVDYGKSCILNCDLCFKKNGEYIENYLSFEIFKKIILEAKSLGLKSVKFLGAGELFENPDFLKVLRYLFENDVLSLVFTNGYILGNDAFARKIFKDEGIENSKDLIKCLQDMDVSLMLKFNSFDHDIQNQMAGMKRGFNYAEFRDAALLNLIETGYNKGNPTRLALAINPITKLNIKESLQIYKWARRRNIYAIVTPSMISGRASYDQWEYSNPLKEDLIELYTDIYSFNILTNLQSFEQIEKEGVSSYAGGHPCNQVACGLYITLSGKVFRCPGNDNNNYCEGDLKEKTLTEIWKSSKNMNLSGKFNCRCIAKDGLTIPKSIYHDVLRNLKKVYKINEFENNKFKLRLNEFQQKLIKDWYDIYNQKIGLSIQLENEFQSDMSPTRICFDNKHFETEKIINNYCQDIQFSTLNKKRCNDLDFYLKTRLDKKIEKSEQEYMYNEDNPRLAVACRCHKGVSNLLYHYPKKISNKTYNFYIFIGHIFVDNSVTNKNIFKNKGTLDIENIGPDSISGDEINAILPNFLIDIDDDKEFDYKRIIREHDITYISEKNRYLRSVFMLINEINAKFEYFLSEVETDESLVGQLDHYVNQHTVKNNTQKINILIEQLIKLMDDGNERKIRIDLLSNLKEKLTNEKIELNGLEELSLWLDEGINGCLRKKSWFHRGNELQLFKYIL